MNASAPGVDRPLFVMGTGRCGLSPVVDLLTAHPDLGWPSQYNKVLPNWRCVSAAARLAGYWPLAGHRLRRLTPRHDEAYPFWQVLYRGFSEPDRDLQADDLTPYLTRRLRRGVATLLRYQGKPRFIAEYSGWSRIGFFNEVFPDAQFVHVVRDGRAVAHSFMHVAWWRGFEGVHRWQFGLLDDDDRADLERWDDSFLARAAIHWRRLIRNVVETSAALPPERFTSIRYEDFVKSPVECAEAVLGFAGLAVDDRTRRRMRSVKIVDANHATLRIPSWRENLRPEQIRMLDELLWADLQQFGYPTPAIAAPV